MKDATQFLKDADNYLDGGMNEDERVRFEQYCRLDEEAGRMLDEHARFRNFLDEHAQRTQLKEKMDQAYDQWKASQPTAVREDAPRSGMVLPLKRYFMKIAGVAAAIALVITLGGVWISHNYNSHKISSYTVLRREIDNIKRSQNNLMNDVHRPVNTPPTDPGQFGGTGFAISADGLVATNAHVVAGADSIYVETSKGTSLKATLVYQDIQSDLAVLQIVDSTFQLPTMPYELRKSSVPLGDEVFTLGYPRDEIVYGKGYISSETGFRGDSSSYQVSMPVNPGNSGGPLIDGKGQVLGIITGKQSPSDDIAFAVKSSFLVNVLDSLPEPYRKKAFQHRTSGLQHLSRVNQIKKLQPYIFLVKVYN